MKGHQDGSRLLVLPTCVSLESLMISGSVLLLLVRWRDISPSLSLASEIVAIQTTVPQSWNGSASSRL